MEEREVIFTLSEDSYERLRQQQGDSLEVFVRQAVVEKLTALDSPGSVGREFAALQDSLGTSHAIAVHLAGCQIFVSHDQHFAALPAILEWKRPEELIASL